MSNKIEKLKQLKALHKNGPFSLQHIIDSAFEILENPLVLNDLEWKVLAYPEADLDNPEYDKYFQNGKVRSDVIEKSISAGFVDIVIRPDKVVLLESEEVDRICGKVYDNDDLPIAALTVNNYYRSFEDVDFTIVQTICEMLSKEICKISYYRDYSQKIIEIYMTKLIEGAMKSEMSTFALGRVEMIYKGLKENLFLAVADISQCDPTYAKLDYYKDVFKQARPSFKYSIYANYIVIVMSTNENVFYPRKCFGGLYSLLEQDKIKVGLSRRFENLFELPRYYDEAVKALNNGIKGASKQQIFAYGDETS